MRKVLKLKKYWKVYKITFRVSFYEGGNLAIHMLYWNRKEKCWLPWEQLTMNLEGKREKDHAYVDTNYYGEEILPWLLSHGLAVPTGKVEEHGLCCYPEYRFREKALRRLDEEGYMEYLTELKRQGEKNKKSA